VKTEARNYNKAQEVSDHIELTHHQTMRNKAPPSSGAVIDAKTLGDMGEFSAQPSPNNEGDEYIGIKTGVVKNFREAQGFGFIFDANNTDHFVHFRDIDATGYRNLAKGQHVIFHAFVGATGLYAKKVRVANV